MVASYFKSSNSLLRISAFGILTGKGLQSALIADGIEEWRMWAGILLLILGPFALFSRRKRTWIILMGLSTGILLHLTIKAFIRLNFQIQFLIEHTLQIGTPLVLGMAITGTLKKNNLVALARWATALAFLGHGLYAVGWQINSTNFMEMTTGLLNISDTWGQTFLLVVGGLDILAAIWLMLNKSVNVPLIYMIGWGLVTALARILFFLEIDDFGDTFPKAISEVLFRICHGLVPLWILLQIRMEKD